MKAIVIISILAALIGCKSAHVQEPLAAKLGGDDLDAQSEFWHQLAEQPITCNDDAFHGLLLYLDDADGAANYDQRVAKMKSRGLLPQDFNRPAGEALSRGTLAVAIVRALDIKGGVTMHLIGPNPRYATRELEFEGLYPTSSPHQTFSGSEFLGIMGRVEDWQRGNPDKAPAAQLPGEVR